jgi:hypothetical protein
MISRGGDDLLDQALDKTRFYPIYSVKRLRKRLIEHYCIKYILQEYNLSSTNQIQYTYTVQEMTYLQTLHPGLPIALLRNARQYSVVQLLKGSTQEIEHFLRKNPYAIRYLGTRTDIPPTLAKSLLKYYPLSIFSWPKIALLEHQAKDAVRLPQVQAAYKNPLAFLQAMKYDPNIALKYPDLKNSPILLKALFDHNPKLAVQHNLCSEQDPRWLLLNNSPDELNQE